ncbi:hypothetical protein Franean1_3118 [Parafrankia sp. EAN1pec]|nr:hypothetical protein Franean1_3118 [Frankia sp. EAN1pec]
MSLLRRAFDREPIRRPCRDCQVSGSVSHSVVTMRSRHAVGSDNGRIISIQADRTSVGVPVLSAAETQRSALRAISPSVKSPTALTVSHHPM